jgi:hypothetical protein
MLCLAVIQAGVNVKNLLESCFRNCLLGLSFVYMPMPGMPRSSDWCSFGFACCIPMRQGGFAGDKRNLFQAAGYSTTRRGLLSTISTGTNTNSNTASKIFSLASSTPDPFTHAVFTHRHTVGEASLALSLCELLYSACWESDPPDKDLV